MTDYEKGVLYKIVSKDHISMYVGSTCSFDNRKRRHKTACNNVADRHHYRRLYQFIRANGGWDNWNMIILEYFPCKTKEELRARERYYYDTLKPTLNMITPTLNIEKQKAERKKRDDTRRDDINAKQNARRRANAEEINAKQRAKYALKNNEENNAKQRAKYALKKKGAAPHAESVGLTPILITPSKNKEIKNEEV